GDPIIREGDIGGKATETVTLGRGEDPVYSPDGKFVAAVTTDPGYQICDDAAGTKGCIAANRVRVFDPSKPPGQEGDAAIGAGRWSIVGWTADHHVLARSATDEVVALGFPGATFKQIAQPPNLPPEFVWGISPTEKTLLYNNPVRSILLKTKPGSNRPFTVEGPKIYLTGFQLGAGEWSPDGKWIAVVAKDTRRPYDTITELGLIDVKTGEWSIIPDSKGAEDITWSTDSKSFVFVRQPKTKRKVREVMTCAPQGACDSVFKATGEIDLLRLAVGS
ncbi:MAG TPA: hypothetical protein VFK89_05000, partial [Actinomycetota bacterium]|nr:hypothetical protein [Actinomycetota bacterium]